MTARLYEPSGKTPIVGLLVGAIAVGVVAVVSAPIYAYATVYCPIAQLSVLLAATFCDVMWGAALGLPQQAVVAAVILLGLWSMSALVESKAFALELEAGRLVATVASGAWLLLG